jgi:hypothetical protein
MKTYRESGNAQKTVDRLKTHHEPDHAQTSEPGWRPSGRSQIINYQLSIVNCPLASNLFATGKTAGLLALFNLNGALTLPHNHGFLNVLDF